MARPPPGRGCAVMVAAWAVATALTMDRRRHASAEGPDAGHEFREVKWLGQVVIGTQSETLDPFPDRPRRGEHQYPGFGSARGQGPADVVAVHAGQVPVQHHHVIAVDRHMFQGRGAVQGHVDGHSLPAQPGRYRPRQHLVVLGDQNPQPGLGRRAGQRQIGPLPTISADVPS